MEAKVRMNLQGWRILTELLLSPLGFDSERKHLLSYVSDGGNSRPSDSFDPFEQCRAASGCGSENRWKEIFHASQKSLWICSWHAQELQILWGASSSFPLVQLHHLIPASLPPPPFSSFLSLTDLFCDSNPDMTWGFMKEIFRQITSLSLCFETHDGGVDSSYCLIRLRRLHLTEGFSDATRKDPG